MATLAEALRGYTPPTESALADPIKQHFATLPQQLVQNQQAMDSAIGGWNKTDFATGQPNANYRPEAINELTQMMPNVGALTAWHGTPHKIVGNFDINKVGIGEGNQVFGHGMYFAEAPEVANTYKNIQPAGGATPSVRRTLGNQELEVGSPEYHAGTILSRNGMTLAQAKKDVQKWIAEGSQDPRQAKLVEGWTKTLETLQKTPKKSAFGELPFEGNLYKVDIPDKQIPNMLNWDEKVPEDLRKRISAKTMEHFGNGATGTSGEHLYKEIVFEMRRNGSKSPEADASKWLNENGVPGIRYLDQASRAKGGTSNFVVFDPSTVKILEENAKPVSRKEIIEKQVKALKE